jgi:hypothetical protein
VEERVHDLTVTELRAQARHEESAGDRLAARTSLERAVELAAAELADAHGALGGLLKREGDAAAAVREYDAGYEVEQRYGLATTYNALNRLVERVLLGVDDLDLCAALGDVRARLQAAVDARADADAWALGDLAVASALLQDRDGAMAAAARLLAIAPAAVVDKYIATVGALAAIDTPARALLVALDAALRDGSR